MVRFLGNAVEAEIASDAARAQHRSGHPSKFERTQHARNITVSRLHQSRRKRGSSIRSLSAWRPRYSAG